MYEYLIHVCKYMYLFMYVCMYECMDRNEPIGQNSDGGHNLENAVPSAHVLGGSWLRSTQHV